MIRPRSNWALAGSLCGLVILEFLPPLNGLTMFWLLVGESALIPWVTLKTQMGSEQFGRLLDPLYLLEHNATFYLILWREQFLFSADAAEELREAIAKKNHELVFLYDINLVDEIWKESRPKPPNKPIRVHDLKYAGLDVASKLSSLRLELAEAGSSAIVISMLDEIAWLLNLVLP